MFGNTSYFKRANSVEAYPRLPIFQLLMLTVLCLSTVGARATAPDSPIKISETSHPWSLRLTLDANQLKDFSIRKIVQQKGVTIYQSAKINLASELSGEGEQTMDIPVGEALQQYPDGLYCQVIQVEGQHFDAESGYTQQYFIYVQVKGEEIRRLSMREYSELANPLDYSFNAQGEPMPFHHGEMAPDATLGALIFEGREDVLSQHSANAPQQIDEH